jgi:hypothetical protein
VLGRYPIGSVIVHYQPGDATIGVIDTSIPLRTIVGIALAGVVAVGTWMGTVSRRLAPVPRTSVGHFDADLPKYT